MKYFPRVYLRSTEAEMGCCLPRIGWCRLRRGWVTFIKMLNCNRLRLPWGTPQRRGNQLELESLHITLCLRSCKFDLISWRAGSCTPYAFNFARSKLWQIQSKAFDRSMATTPTSVSFHPERVSNHLLIWSTLWRKNDPWESPLLINWRLCFIYSRYACRSATTKQYNITGWWNGKVIVPD